MGIIIFAFIIILLFTILCVYFLIMDYSSNNKQRENESHHSESKFSSASQTYSTDNKTNKKRYSSNSHSESTRLNLGNVKKNYKLLSKIIAKVIKTGSPYSKRHIILINDFQEKVHIYNNILVTLVEFYIKKDFNFELTPNFSRTLNLDVSEKQRLVELLFKLAATDDGIKTDEWRFLNRIMENLKVGDGFIKRMHHRYGPLRSDSEQEDSRKSASSKKTEKENTSTPKLYAILGLPNGSDMQQVHKAYRKLALTYHPDLPKNANNKDCVKKMAEINIAYEALMKLLS